jgi:ATP-binding cassette subfamily C protein CydD
MASAGERPSSPEARLFARAAGARALLALGIACGFVAAVAVVAAAFLTSVVVSDVYLEGGALTTVAQPLALVAFLAILRAPLLATGDLLTQRAAGRLTSRLRADLTAHLFALGPAWTSGERTGELTTVMVNGMDALGEDLTLFQPARALAVAIPLFVLAAVLLIDPPTTLVLLLTGPVLVLLLAVIGGRTRAITERRFAELRWLSAFFLDMLGGLATLKMFGRSAEQVGNVRTISRQYGDTTMEVLRTAFQTSLVLEWGAAIAVAVVAVEISLRLMDGAIEFQRALAVLIIVPEFFLPLRTLATRYHAGSAGRSVAERICEILDEAVPSSRAMAAADGSAYPFPTVTTVPPGSDIHLADVTVIYPGRDAPALDRLELTIPNGRVVALVGATGAGKSTVASLLLRFIAPNAGRILVGGVPLDAIELSAWRANVAWVPQRPHLFHGTVADNLRLARPDASAADIAAAAREAGADAFIDDLPLGYETPVGEGGVRLSGGQRQRIAIARAFLADAPFVILDEATSHLDAASEAVIRDAVGRLARRRTVLIVSHRLRLVSMADLVAVLDRGGIIESGSPVELAARDGPYRRLLAAGVDRADPGGPS